MLGIFNCLNRERKMVQSPNYEEQQYLNLIKDIINNGSMEESRNGKTYTKFGNMMKFS